MRQYWLAVAAATLVSACSGNPFLTNEEGVTPETGIPEVLLDDVDRVSYNRVAQTLTVTGESLDNSPIVATYTRKPGLDRNGYEAYTTQDASLQRHVTAYVREIDGATATIIMAGGQFQRTFAGSHYSRSGVFDPPSVVAPGGLVSYAGGYVGLLNAAGDGGDLLAVAPGTPTDIRPVQAAEVTGDVLINADFSDNVVNGIVYNRVIVDFPGNDLSNQDLALVAATIQADGSFTDDVVQGTTTVGTYGGIFGGTDASAVAGTLHAENHIEGLDQIEEFGVFVLSQCGQPGDDPVCDQPVP